MNHRETLAEAERLGLGLGLTEELRLTVEPKSRITPELRAALKENKGEIVCEILWQRYLEGMGGSALPPPSPRLREAFGDPEAFVAALTEFELVRAYWGTIERLSGSPDAAVLFTKDGIIGIAPEDAG
jgi:hypothetical protein